MSWQSNVFKVVCVLIVGVAGLLLVSSHPAEAATIRLDQDWVNRNDPLNTAHTVGFFDDTGVAGVGESRMLLDRFTILVSLDGVPQNFMAAQFTDPPSLLVEGNTYARYVDGVFHSLQNVQTGGSARVPLINQSTFLPAGGYFVAGGLLDWFLPVSGVARYTLESSTLSVVPIPSPTALPLLLTGMIGLGLVARRRRRSSG